MSNFKPAYIAAALADIADDYTMLRGRISDVLGTSELTVSTLREHIYRAKNDIDLAINTVEQARADVADEQNALDRGEEDCQNSAAIVGAVCDAAESSLRRARKTLATARDELKQAQEWVHRATAAFHAAQNAVAAAESAVATARRAMSSADASLRACRADSRRNCNSQVSAYNAAVSRYNRAVQALEAAAAALRAAQAELARAQARLALCKRARNKADSAKVIAKEAREISLDAKGETELALQAQDRGQRLTATAQAKIDLMDQIVKVVRALKLELDQNENLIATGFSALKTRAEISNDRNQRLVNELRSLTRKLYEFDA